MGCNPPRCALAVVRPLGLALDTIVFNSMAGGGSIHDPVCPCLDLLEVDNCRPYEPTDQSYYFLPLGYLTAHDAALAAHVSVELSQHYCL